MSRFGFIGGLPVTRAWRAGDKRPWRPAPSDLPLVVDLDETLLRGGTLGESLVAGLFHRPISMLLDLARQPLPLERASLEARMARAAPLDVESLPLRAALVAYLRGERARGRNLHLATHGDLVLARRIAARLALFDGVHRRSPPGNPAAESQASDLQARFPGGFAYAGSQRRDLPVWASAQSLVIIGASRSVGRQARRLGRPIEVEIDSPGALGAWGRALRLHQWSKNALIFTPLLLSDQARDPGAWAACVAGFLVVGIAASGGYLINDLADLGADRRHRTKRTRPLAGGEIPVPRALGAAVLMIGLALVAALALSKLFALALCAYLAATLAYSLALKRIVLLDVFVLGGLYTLRLICGTLLARCVSSPWLLTFSVFFFLSMSLAKRHVELQAATGPPDQALPGRGYRPADAPLTLALGVATSAAAVLVIVQYMMSEAFPSGVYALPAALWTTPILLGLWVCRIWLLAHRGTLDDDPVAFAVRDRVSLILGGLLCASFLLARA